MAKVIDIDKRVKSYAPVEIKFRGKTYKLGGSATTLVACSAALTGTPAEEGEDEVVYALRLLVPVLAAANPELAKAVEAKPLNEAETLALLPVLSEVVRSLGSIRFSA